MTNEPRKTGTLDQGSRVLRQKPHSACVKCNIKFAKARRRSGHPSTPCGTEVDRSQPAPPPAAVHLSERWPRSTRDALRLAGRHAATPSPPSPQTRQTRWRLELLQQICYDNFTHQCGSCFRKAANRGRRRRSFRASFVMRSREQRGQELGLAAIDAIAVSSDQRRGCATDRRRVHPLRRTARRCGRVLCMQRWPRLPGPSSISVRHVGRLRLCGARIVTRMTTRYLDRFPGRTRRHGPGVPPAPGAR